MINGKKILAIIPARSGSKGVLNKNIKYINKKPLIAWTIIESLKSKYIDKIVVSSDSKKILKISQKYGNIDIHCRPKKLSKDKSKITDVIKNTLIYFSNYEYIVLLQPTSPLRNMIIIDKCLKKVIKQNINSAASITKVTKNINWFFKLKKNNKGILPLKNIFPNDTNRQAAENYYQFSGDFYIIKKKWFLKNYKIVHKNTLVTYIKNDLTIDIDNDDDFKKATKLQKKKLLKYGGRGKN